MGQFLDPEVSELLGETPVFSAAPATRELAMGAFEGADRLSRELNSWAPPVRSADGDLLSEKGDLDVRARDAIRNDSYVQNGADIQKDTIVGSKYRMNSKPNYRALGLDEVWAEEFQAEFEAKFGLWAESGECYPDAAGKLTLTELTRLAVGVFSYTGEVFASVEWIREVGRPYNTAIQMIDLDRLSNPYGAPDTRNLRRGVVMNDRGVPLGYHVTKAHPTDNDTEGRNYEWQYVAAKKPWGRQQAIHIFDPWRPEQSRGFSKMVSALKEMRMTKKYRDIVLQSAVLQATYAATIESELPPESAFAAMGGGENSYNGWCAQHLGGIAAYAGSARNMQIDGVKIPHLYPGTKLNLQNAATPGGIGSTFEQSMLRYIASALNVSYEQLSKDYSQTNYSSARAGMNETQKHMNVRKSLVADRFASHVAKLWLEEAINKGEMTSLPRKAPNFYAGMNAAAYSRCEWIGASHGQIDELKETQAAVLRIRNNLSTHEAELGRLGKDWRDTFEQLGREKKLMDKYGLIMAESNGMNAASGNPRSPDSQDSQDAPKDKKVK